MNDTNSKLALHITEKIDDVEQPMEIKVGVPRELKISKEKMFDLIAKDINGQPATQETFDKLAHVLGNALTGALQISFDITGSWSLGIEACEAGYKWWAENKRLSRRSEGICDNVEKCVDEIESAVAAIEKASESILHTQFGEKSEEEQ